MTKTSSHVSIWRFFAAAGLAFTLALPAVAQQEILVGHVAGFTGPVNKDANEMNEGATVAFAAANEGGGFGGRKFRIIKTDDTYKPDETVSGMKAMIGKVVALLPATGSANMDKVIKSGILDGVALPLVGTIPSAESARSPLNPNIFHFRAGDRDQLEKIVDQLTTVGLTKIAVLASKNTASAERVAIVEQALQRRNLKLAATGLFVVGTKTDFSSATGALKGAGAQAVLPIGPPSPVADLVKEIRRQGITAQLLSISYADAAQISSIAGPDLARGFIIAQVLPNLSSTSKALVNNFRADFKKYAKLTDSPTHFNLEGYISAKLIIESIRRSNDATPEGVRRGLEMLRSYDMGGYTVDFSPTQHT
ncbi:MAG: Amino acid/amide transporter substrate-binding protein family, partial [Polaromonas sp.]|nr:Amino acid/amide transporter substrate-binding protein family [Polaromonas sp.]